MMPRGKISRDQLSRLLLVLIALGVDLLDFLTNTDEDIKCKQLVRNVALGLWTWSLLQFVLVTGVVKADKNPFALDSVADVARVKKISNSFFKKLFRKPEFWSNVVTIMMQDLPFLTFRLYKLIAYNEFGKDDASTTIFFAVKNLVMIILAAKTLISLMRAIAQKKHKDQVTHSDLERLREVLGRLASEAVSEGTISQRDIQGASFQSMKDGSLLVKMRLRNESSMHGEEYVSADGNQGSSEFKLE